MPNLTIYVPGDLAEQLKRHDVNVSKACQAALRRKVRMSERRGGDREPIGQANPASRRDGNAA